MVQLVLTIITIILGVVWFKTDSLIVWGIGMTTGVSAAVFYLKQEFKSNEHLA